MTKPAAITRRRGSILLAVLFLVFPALLGAQQRSLVRVLGADQLVGRTIGDMQLRELIGNVRLQQDNVYIDCDRAVQNISQNSVQLIGNVVITQDTLTLKTDRGHYNGQTGLASSRQGVFLNDGHVTLTAKLGTYGTESKVAEFLNDVTIDDTAAVITSQRMHYFRDSSLVVAWDSVRIRFKDENVQIHADSVRHFPDDQRSEFYKQPVLWQIDTSYVRRTAAGRIDSLALDTLNIAGGYMEALRDTSNIFIVRDSVRIVRREMSARSDAAIFLRSDSLIDLSGDPILWYGENQITGDSITALLSDNKLRTLDVIGNAFSISRSKPEEADTLYPPGRFDQTSGKRILMEFADSKPQYIRVEGTAISLYYLYDEGALNGVRRESSDLIIISFDDGKVTEIRSIKGVEGTYYPEKYVNGKESSYNLTGFSWREDRPRMIPLLSVPPVPADSSRVPADSSLSPSDSSR
ncbi:LPS export ABC transporter periplasmic protein LptC [bacterium]|nr:LPS export ABC transporter periplasmic protein LptC [bacterium]